MAKVLLHAVLVHLCREVDNNNKVDETLQIEVCVEGGISTILKYLIV